MVIAFDRVQIKSLAKNCMPYFFRIICTMCTLVAFKLFVSMHIILLKKLLRKPKILKNRKYFLKSNTFAYLIHEVLIQSFLMHGSILLKI